MDTRPVLVFDGHCGFCTRAVGWLQRLDRHERIACIPSQAPGALERYGLSREQADETVWLFQGERRLAGAAAVNAALDTALGRSLFGRTYRVPGSAAVQDRVYRWVAEHRGRIPGVTPWCERHPEGCSGREGDG